MHSVVFKSASLIKTILATGQAECTDCPAEFYCTADRAVKRTCPKGRYCPTGTGKFSSNEVSTLNMIFLFIGLSSSQFKAW